MVLVPLVTRWAGRHLRLVDTEPAAELLSRKAAVCFVELSLTGG